MNKYMDNNTKNTKNPDNLNNLGDARITSNSNIDSMNNPIFNKLSVDLFSLMFLLQHKLVRPQDIIRECPIPPSHIRVIFFLRDNGSYSMSEVASILNISRSNMTPIVDKLIAEGLLTRYEDKTDRRIIRIEITQKALDFFHDLKEKIKERLKQKLSKLSPEDAELLSVYIDSAIKIIENLQDKEQ